MTITLSTEMKFDSNIEVPEIIMEPSAMFAYPTCMADVYTPSIEQICLPERRFPQLNMNIRVAPGHTGARTTGSIGWKLYNTLSRVTRSATPTLTFPDQFIFDARFDTEKNIGHVIDHAITPVLFAQKKLSERLNRDVKIHVILIERASELGLQAYEALGIPTICTDGDVYGNIVEISLNDNSGDAVKVPLSSYKYYGIQSQVFNDLNFKGYTSGTPERIFIARKGSRSLINNNEVSEFLKQRGFTTYYFEDLSHSEKWSIVRNAKVAIVVHGAGSANFVFNCSGLKSPDIPGSGLSLIEIFSPSFTLTGYRHLAALFNGRWCAVRGQVTPEMIRYLDIENRPRNVYKSPIKDAIKVDLQTIQLALDYLGVHT